MSSEDEPKEQSLEDELYAGHLFGVKGEALKVRPDAREPEAPAPDVVKPPRQG